MTTMTDTAAQAAIGAPARELHLPTVRAEATRLAQIAQRTGCPTWRSWLRSSRPRSTTGPSAVVSSASTRPASLA